MNGPHRQKEYTDQLKKAKEHLSALSKLQKELFTTQFEQLKKYSSEGSKEDKDSTADQKGGYDAINEQFQTQDREISILSHKLKSLTQKMRKHLRN
mmetsp:Transcript_24446/g.36670  ORF Transcript_24446/g.36670 Transcript_24446/m.36670 type:complete len:96 (-) Transcript_24446:124-411(-)